MSSKLYPSPPRHRGFSSLALLCAGALLFSSTSAALLALSHGAKAAVTQFVRRPGGFTQAPTRAFLGLRPGRDPEGRGGVWSAARRAEVARAADRDRLVAMVGEPQGMAGLHTVAVDSAPGSSYPWEGSAPSAGGSVNTGNGDRLTAVHLVGWRVRGGMALDLALYHSSQTNCSDELGAGWTWTYDVYVNNLASNPVLHWGDGTSVPYAAPGGGGGGGARAAAGSRTRSRSSTTSSPRSPCSPPRPTRPPPASTTPSCRTPTPPGPPPRRTAPSTRSTPRASSPRWPTATATRSPSP